MKTKNIITLSVLIILFVAAVHAEEIIFQLENSSHAIKNQWSGPFEVKK